MKSKKLIRNVLVMLVALMTTAMVLSSCSNASDSEYANITIRLSGSGSGRAISSEEKSAATFNVYFNDLQVASNVSGTYNGTAQVGTRLNVRVDALVNGKRIARGENTITVKSPSNDVDVKLEENREEEKIPTIGSIIMRDGSYLTKEEITSANQTQAIAVVYKVSGGKAWAVGIRQEQKAWCDISAEGYNTDFTELTTNVSGSAGALTFTGYQNGSGGWSKLRTALGSNDDTDQEGNYPAWEWVNNYGRFQDMTGDFASGWYFPSVAELFDIWQQKDTLNASLSAVNGSTFGSKYYWSSSQCASTETNALLFGFGNGDSTDDDKSTDYDPAYVCAVRQFTY